MTEHSSSSTSLARQPYMGPDLPQKLLPAKVSSYSFFRFRHKSIFQGGVVSPTMTEHCCGFLQSFRYSSSLWTISYGCCPTNQIFPIDLRSLKTERERKIERKKERKKEKEKIKKVCKNTGRVEAKGGERKDSSYRKENVTILCNKINWLTLFRELIVIRSENHTKPIDTLCEKKSR
jgi:hypothetical protein